MRVAILNITGGGLSGGYKKYLQRIIPRLQTYPIIQDLLVAVPSTPGAEDVFLKNQNVKWINYKNSWLKDPFSSEIESHLVSFRPDIIFIPTARTVRFHRIPVVSMVRNMEPISYDGPNPLSERLKNFARAAKAKRAVLRADMIVAVSDHVKQSIMERWGVNEEKIGVVCHGIDIVPDDERPNSISRDWDGRFLFTAGSIRPARGLEDALLAFARLSPTVKSLYQGIVVAGEASRNMTSYFEELKRLTIGLGISGHVCWVGSLSERQMAWCYNNCSAFVMTSRVEACPNIALEAMAYGSAIISTKSAPMPEFFADVAYYYDPGNEMELSEVINNAIAIPHNKKIAMKKAAQNRAGDFSWDKTAEQTIQQFQKVLEKSNK